MEREYEVEVREYLTRRVKVTASSESEALDKVQKMHHSSEIVLDYKDYSGVDFEIVEGE